MSITSYKITDSDISSKGVVAAPTVLSGSPEENKKVFDRLVREVLKGDFNALVDALAASTGAGEIGAAVEGLTGETVQALLSGLKIGLDSKAASADVDAALEEKSESSVTDTHIKSVAFDADTGVFTFTKENGTAVEIDTALEKVAVNFAYDEDTQSLILTLADGSTQRVSLAAFLTTTEFENSDTLEWSVAADGGKVKATIKTGSITETMLDSALKTMLKGYVSAAAASATNAAASESASLSYRTDAQTAATAAAESREQAASSQTAAAGSAAAAKSDADRAEAASAHPPQISRDGYWELWDLTQSTYVKTTYQAQGPAGPDGDSYTVKGLYATLSALQTAHPTGSAGDAWFVGTADSNVVYQWDVDKAAWVNVGALKGPSGAAFTYDDFTPEQLAALKGDDGAPGIVISETQPTSEGHPVWLDPNGDAGAENPLNITGATPGQIAKITAVDDNGKPTAWEPVDMPSGDGAEKEWTKIIDVDVAETTVKFEANNLNGATEFHVRWSAMQNESSVDSGLGVVINDIGIGAISMGAIVKKAGNDIYGWTHIEYDGLFWTISRSGGAISPFNITATAPSGVYTLKEGVGKANTIKLEAPTIQYAPVTGKLEVWAR